jgi:hypothetical protein
MQSDGSGRVGQEYGTEAVACVSVRCIALPCGDPADMCEKHHTACEPACEPACLPAVPLCCHLLPTCMLLGSLSGVRRKQNKQPASSITHRSLALSLSQRSRVIDKNDRREKARHVEGQKRRRRPSPNLSRLSHTCPASNHPSIHPSSRSLTPTFSLPKAVVPPIPPNTNIFLHTPS